MIISKKTRERYLVLGTAILISALYVLGVAWLARHYPALFLGSS
jgi:hypothetical protein